MKLHAVCKSKELNASIIFNIIKLLIC